MLRQKGSRGSGDKRNTRGTQVEAEVRGGLSGPGLGGLCGELEFLTKTPQERRGCEKEL